MVTHSIWQGANKTTSPYDLASQRTQIQRPDTTTLTTEYNADGTVLDQKDGKNNAILTHSYDPIDPTDPRPTARRGGSPIG